LVSTFTGSDTIVVLRGAKVVDHTDTIARVLASAIAIASRLPFSPKITLQPNTILPEPAPGTCTLTLVCQLAKPQDATANTDNACSDTVAPAHWEKLCAILERPDEPEAELAAVGELHELLESNDAWIDQDEIPGDTWQEQKQPKPAVELEAELAALYAGFLTDELPTVAGFPSAPFTSRMLAHPSFDGGYRYEVRVCRGADACNDQTDARQVASSVGFEVRPRHDLLTEREHAL